LFFFHVWDIGDTKHQWCLTEWKHRTISVGSSKGINTLEELVSNCYNKKKNNKKFTHFNISPNPYEFVSSMEHENKIFKNQNIFFFSAIKMNDHDFEA